MMNLSKITSTIPCYIVTVCCLDCDTIEQIESVWESRKDAEERQETLDRVHGREANSRKMANIEETVRVGK